MITIDVVDTMLSSPSDNPAVNVTPPTVVVPVRQETVHPLAPTGMVPLVRGCKLTKLGVDETNDDPPPVIGEPFTNNVPLDPVSVVVPV